MSYDLFGLGNALMDVQVFIDEKFLNDHNIEKGIMTLVDEDMSRKLISSIAGLQSTSVPGGSCGNTMSTVAMLGGKSVFTYAVADDLYGRLYEKQLSERGVKSIVSLKHKGLTGSSIILTTKDADRTMLTHLGVCREFTKNDIDMEVFSESKVFHTTGYELDTPLQKEALNEAMLHAKKRGIKVSFDIADPFCVERNATEIKDLITNNIDIIFGNQDEAKILTGKADPTEAGKVLIEMGAEIALVKVGKDGSYIFTKDNYAKIPVYKAREVLDSTGCGDIYAGGFLYGYTKGIDPVKSAHIASYLASEIISVAGVQLEKLDFDQINKKVNELQNA